MRSKARPTPELFNEFVSGLELKSIRLVSSTVKSNQESLDPPTCKLGLSEKISYEQVETGFKALCEYSITITEAKSNKEMGSIDFQFSLLYQSNTPVTKGDFPALFDIFSKINLPNTAWPYAREFVQNMMMRLDWPVFTLPLRKFGASKRVRSKPEAPAKKS